MDFIRVFPKCNDWGFPRWEIVANWGDGMGKFWPRTGGGNAWYRSGDGIWHLVKWSVFFWYYTLLYIHAILNHGIICNTFHLAIICCLKISSDVSMVETERARFKHVQQCMVPALEARKNLAGKNDCEEDQGIHTLFTPQNSLQFRSVNYNFPVAWGFCRMRVEVQNEEANSPTDTCTLITSRLIESVVYKMTNVYLNIQSKIGSQLALNKLD